MISREMIKKIKQIEIKSNKLVEEIFSGEYRAGFKGKGMEFEDIRQYYPGDDIRNIDWNVTARHNNTFVKLFSEERQLNMFLLIDMSSSNRFANKKDLIAELGATLAFSANKNNDRIGVIFFTDRVEKFIPSRNGKKHILSIIEDVLSFEPAGRGTDLAKALQYFNRVEKKQSIVFLISDFLDLGYKRDLKITAAHHDLILIRVIDRSEEIIPAGAIFTFQDLETGETIVLDNLKNDIRLTDNLNLPQNNLINLYTDEDYVKPLKNFFRRRDQR